MNRICSAINIKIAINRFKKDKTVCRNCYNRNESKRKNNNYTLPPKKIITLYQQPKNENGSKNNNKNRVLIVGFSICGITYPTNHILFRKQEPIFIITKSLNQYPNIEAQTSDEVEALENYENSNVVFDDMLLSKQSSDIDLFFTRCRHNKIDIYYISQSYFHLPKNTIRNYSNVFIFLSKLYGISYYYFMI